MLRAAKLVAASWKPKSRTDCTLPLVVNIESSCSLALKTSPNMKKSSLPWALAYDSIAGAHSCQNSTLTCFIVSMRKPSTPRSTHGLKISIMPSTTSGCSVNRSSRPTKSP